VRLKSLILLAAAAIVLAVGVLALGHSGGRSAHAPSAVVSRGNGARLTIANYAFSPTTLTVRAGATVSVTNTDSTAHTATAESGAFDSGTLKPGRSAHLTLSKPGTYTYLCQFHAFMTGTIRVVG
jgi:plastocyanin